MARRKNQANIPAETLERARQQAAGEQPVTKTSPLTGKPKPERRYNTVKPKVGEIRSRTRTPAEMTLEEIEEQLEHPTKIVTEAELRAQYGFVLTDLRNMGVLAAGLFLALIGLALFFVR